MLSIILFIIFKVTGLPNKYERAQKKKNGEDKEGKTPLNDNTKGGKRD